MATGNSGRQRVNGMWKNLTICGPMNSIMCVMCGLQLLVTFDPVLVEKVATLLYLVMEDNPSMPRLYLTGVFFFILMYTGSNVLPVARFLKYTHLKQAFRSDEVPSTLSQTLLSIVTITPAISNAL